jgi:integrase
MKKMHPDKGGPGGTATDIVVLYGKVRGLGPASMEFLHTVLKTCFKSAVKNKVIPINPVADAEEPAGEAEPIDLVLDEEELKTLVRGFAGHSLYGIVAVAAFTGMRRNEILALRRNQDVDLDRGPISVTRNVEVTSKHGARIITPKSKNSVREFEIGASLVGLLRRAGKLPCGLLPACLKAPELT